MRIWYTNTALPLSRRSTGLWPPTPTRRARTPRSSSFKPRHVGSSTRSFLRIYHSPPLGSRNARAQALLERYRNEGPQIRQTQLVEQEISKFKSENNMHYLEMVRDLVSRSFMTAINATI